MNWFSGESIFDRLLGTDSNSPKNTYYHCTKETLSSKYNCRIIYGEHRIIPVYPDVPQNLHLQVLEGALSAPVTIK